MRRTIKVGLIQQSCTGNTAENMDKLKHSIEDVASKGAELVVLQELHNTLYFCQTENNFQFGFVLYQGVVLLCKLIS